MFMVLQTVQTQKGGANKKNDSNTNGAAYFCVIPPGNAPQLISPDSLVVFFLCSINAQTLHRDVFLKPARCFFRLNQSAHPGNCSFKI